MRVCPNCGEKVVPEDKVCPTCRAPLVREKRKPMKGRNIAIILGAVLVIATIIVVCAVPLKTVSYTVTERYQTTETYYVTEPYTETETYYEKEPFTRTETYTEREPYNKSVPIDYLVTSKGSYTYFWTTGFDAWVYIKNTDLKSGTFTVLFNLTLKGGARTTKSASKYIAIGETEKVQVSYRGAYLSSFTYSVTPPTKTITAYRDVQKTREVIEYRNVQKTREVIKYRDVPKERTVWKERPVRRFKDVSLLEYLIGY